MKVLIALAIFAILVAASAVAQTPMAGAAQIISQNACAAAPYNAPPTVNSCNGALHSFWHEYPTQSCAQAPTSTAQLTIVFCINETWVKAYTVDYRTSAAGVWTDVTTSLAGCGSSGGNCWFDTWQAAALGSTTTTTSSGSSFEMDLTYDPNIHTGANPPGAFVIASPINTGATPLGVMVGVSQTNDPRNAWNSYSNTTYTGDSSPRVSFDKNGLYVTGHDVGGSFTGFILGWGITAAQGLYNPSYGILGIPAPSVIFDHTSTPAPGFLMFGVNDYTATKASTDPHFFLSDCFNNSPGCGGALSTAKFVINELAWTSSTTATLTLQTGNVTPGSTRSINGPSPPIANQPNNVVYRLGPSLHPGHGIELSNKHIYFSEPSAQGTRIAQLSFEMDMSTPLSPTIVQEWILGGGTGIGDATMFVANADTAGNVFFQGTISDPSNMFLAPYVSWIDTDPTSTRNAQGTITTTTTCPGAGCVTIAVPANSAQISANITGSFTGTLRTENQSGGFVSCTPTPGLTATSTYTAPNSTTCPTAGITQLRVVATALPAGTPTVTFTPLYGPYLLNAPTATSAALTAATGGTCGASVTSSCAPFTITNTNSGAPNQVGLIASNAGGNTLQFEDGAGNLLTCTYSGSGSSTPTTGTSTTNASAADAWTCPISGQTHLVVHQTAIVSGTPTIKFQQVAGSSIGNDPSGTICGFPVNSQGPIGEFGQSAVGSDPNLLWLPSSYGGATTYCNWASQVDQFGVHVPTAGSNVTVAPLTASIATSSTQPYSTSITSWVDGSATAACGSSSVYWKSSNTGVATVNPTTGVATGVAPGTTNITATCSLVASSTPAVLTVTSSGATCQTGGYCFPTH